MAGLLLIRQEKRAPEPMLPPELWANPTLRVAALGNLAIGALMIGVIAFMPTSIQGVLQRGAFDSALGLALLSLGWPITGWFAARMIIRVPYRTVATAGGVVLVVSTVLLLVARGEWGFALICAGALANGLGCGLISLTMLLAVQASVGWQLRGIATSSVIFMRTVGQALGTALLGALLNLGLARRLPGADDPVALLMDPLRRAALPAAELTRLVAAVAFSMQDVYLGLLVLALALFGCARLMPTGTLAEAQPYRPVDGAAATRHIRPSR